MRLLSFEHNGREAWGALVGQDAIVDLSDAFPTLKDALASGEPVTRMVEGRSPGLKLDEVTLLPVIPNPSKILCIGVNYHDHRIETGREETAKPVVFARFANSQVAHGAPLIRPPESDNFDYEGEIAIIIGKRGRRITRENAWEHVAGYAPYCDGTIRDWQRHTQQWIPGKTFVGTGGFGPWMVTRDEIPDGADLSLVTRLNGVEVQRSSTDLMIFDVPAILAYCSVFTELEPGDVIATGTPGGIGGKRVPPLWLKPGDTLEIEVGQVGALVHPIQDEIQ